MTDQSALTLPRQIIRLGDLSSRKATEFDVTPDVQGRRAIAASLDVDDVAKLRMTGTLTPTGRADWVLTGHLGATVTQPCTVTLAPVKTRIDEDVIRRYSAEAPDPEGSEMEMPEDDTIEPLPRSVDLIEVLTEALSLAIPAFPRADDVEALDITAIPDGATPIVPEETKPFAGLAGLRDKLAEGSKE